jgi:cob(I)alamin adenosyltransferase
MSLLLSKKHLRVEIPQTIDGMNTLIGDDGRAVIKTVFLPFTAKRTVESNQAKKPKHLQAKITVVEGDLIEKKAAKESAQFTPEQIEKLQSMTKNKGGRPKKVQENENN